MPARPSWVSGLRRAWPDSLGQRGPGLAEPQLYPTDDVHLDRRCLELMAAVE